MSHRENVRIIREAFKGITVKKWEAGDAALVEVPKEADGHNIEPGKPTVATVAAEAGVEFAALRIYRDVAAAWPPVTRVTGASWTVHRELLGLELEPGGKATPEERSAWLKDFIKKDAAESGIQDKVKGKVTADQVREARGLDRSRIRREMIPEAITPAQEEVIAARVMAQPDRAARVVTQPGVRASTGRAFERHDRQVERTAAVNTHGSEEAADEWDQHRGVIDILGLVAHARGDVKRVIEGMGDLPKPLTETQRERFKEAVDDLRNHVDGLASLIAGDSTAALEAILEAGE